MDIYREEILERYSNPHNFGELENPNGTALVVNTSCGDSIGIFIKIDNGGILKDIKFKGVGCAISKASVDILIDKVKGKKVSVVKKISAEDVLKNANLVLSPSRIKCGLMGWEALIKAIENYESNKKN